MQDTLKQKIPVRTDTLKPFSDNVQHQFKTGRDTLLQKRETQKPVVTIIAASDTTTLCLRNCIADVTFHDSSSFVFKTDKTIAGRFPFAFTGMNRQRHEEAKVLLVSHLKKGDELPEEPYRIDWIVPAILLSAFLYALVRTASGNMFRGLMKFILFRGINESISRETSEILQLQSTLFNLASFLNISLFGFLLTIKYDLPLPGISGFALWTIFLGIIFIAITLRHIICRVTGNFSGENEIFREYLVGIYHSYRLAGLFLFIINILILYTTILPLEIYFTAGFCIAGGLYLVRVSRLCLIFINRHASILYLILYLCALEILPVIIIVKYVTGLVV